MALAASAATSSSLRAGQPAPHTMQHVPKIVLHRSLGPCTAPARLPPLTRRHRAATPAALPARGMRSRRREPPAERDDDLLAQEPRDEMQLWKDRLAAMRPTQRSAAVAQLLRIEEEGAFAGLVGGSPGADTDETAADSDDAEEAPAGQQQRQQQQQGGDAWTRGLDARDKRAVTDLVASVTRWRRRLDYVIEACSGRRMADLDAPLRQILRIGALELVEQGAPSHTVNEHVELAKRIMHKGSGGVANFVLREIARRREAGTLPQPPPPAKGMSREQAAEALAVGASHPTWLVAGWLQQYGPKATMELLRWNNRKPHHAVRLAPGLDPAAVCKKLQGLDVAAQPSRYLPREFITVQQNMQGLLASGLIGSGQGQVQDEAAGLVVALLQPQPGEDVLDACAAPGGKTLFSAARMQGQGSVLALDIGRSRLAALRRMAGRQQHGRIVSTRAADLREFAEMLARRRRLAATGGEEAQQAQQEAEQEADQEAQQAQQAQQGPSEASAAAGDDAADSGRKPWPTQFDRVLLDAPCSGTGVLAKRADLRWRRTPEQIEHMVSLQGELLAAAASLVKPGGILVYSTCSLEASENQQQVAAFLASHPDFAVEPPPAEAGIPAHCLSPEGYLLMLPHVHGTDGAFAVRLRRSGGDESSSAAAEEAAWPAS